MAQYQVTVSDEVLQPLFSWDDGLARLAEQVLNRILESRLQSNSRPDPTSVRRKCRDIGTATGTSRSEPALAGWS